MSLPYRLINRRFIVVMLSCLLLACLIGRWQQASQARNANRTASAASAASSSDEAALSRLKSNESFGKLPLYFVENRGQLDKRVGYYIQGRDKTVYFSDTGVTFALHSGSPAASADGSGSAQRYIVKLDFVGARAGVNH